MITTCRADSLLSDWSKMSIISSLLSFLNIFLRLYSQFLIKICILLFQTVLEVCSLLPKTNIGTLVVSIVAIVGLILAKELNSYLSKKLPIPIPVELLGVSIQKYMIALIKHSSSYAL